MSADAGERLPVLENDPNVLDGQTVFAGTRVRLEEAEDYRRGGRSREQFLRDYPSVARWQAAAVWAMSSAELRAHIARGPSDDTR